MKVELLVTTKEGDNPSFEKKVKALKKIEDNSVIYTYIDELGKNILTLKEKVVSIKRVGESVLDTLLKKNNETELVYKSQYIDTTFRIFTQNLEINENGFSAKYSIYQDKEMINEIIISVKELI